MQPERSMPYGRHVRPDERNLLESAGDEWHSMRRPQRLYEDGHVPGRDVHGREPGRLRRRGSVPHGRRVRPVYRHLLESRKAGRRCLRRRQRLHDGRRVSRRNLHGREPSRLQCRGSVPHGRRLRSGHGPLLEPREAGRRIVRRRQRLHDGRHVSGGNVHGREPGRLRRRGSVPHGRCVRPVYRRLLESLEAGRCSLRRRQRLHDGRCVSGGDVHGRKPGRLRRGRPVSRRGRLQSFDGRLLEPGEAEWDGVQRRQRVHDERHVSGGDVHGREPGSLRRRGSVPQRRGLRSGHGPLLESREAGRRRLQRRRRLHDDRHLPRRRLHRSEPRRLCRCGSVPRRRRLQPDDRHVLRAERARRDGL